jgi:Flp pilus assembly pilin Flp
MKTLLQRLLRDDDGQDLIEYALLTGLIAVGGAIVFPAFREQMANAYEAWNADTQALWQPPPPSS